MINGDHPAALGPFAHKIRPRHLDRLAVVYVRQSSPHQVADHRESADLQYQLCRRAVELGWLEPRVLVIDDDQGVVASPSITVLASNGCSPRSRSAESGSSSAGRSAACHARIATGTSCSSCAPVPGVARRRRWGL